MHLSITHTTQYHYSEPLLYSIQQLKLTPQDGFGQRVKHWTITVNGQLYQYDDAHGNVVHSLVVDRNASEIKIVATGEVETGLQHLELQQLLPLTIYLRDTKLTQPGNGIRAFTESFGTINSLSDLQRLSEMIVHHVPYVKGATEVYTTASQAWDAGSGVCQDHAHIFIACCRILGIPTRYVSGYLFTDDSDLLESHAWVDAWLEDTGWVSIDVSNRCLANGTHVRLAVGLDYHDACPVSGIRVGGGSETMGAGVNVMQSKVSKNTYLKQQTEQIQQ